MSYLTYFWKFYHTTQKILEKQDGFEIASKEMISYLDALKKDVGGFCPRPCTVCSDNNKCEFFHALVVFGDRMLIKHFTLSSPIIEPNYYGTHVGMENMLDNITRMSESIQRIDKKQWSSQQKEILYVYFYILQYLNKQRSVEETPGFYQTSREESLFDTLRSLLRNTEYSSNLTPQVYKSIQEEDRIFMLPSLWQTIIWFFTLILSLVILINALWYSYTDEIRTNIKNIKTKSSVQKALEGIKNE